MTDALAYLDAPHTRAPPRYARVTIQHGAEREPYIRDYLVGPLPPSEHTAFAPLEGVYHREVIPLNARYFFLTNDIGELFVAVWGPLENVTEVRRPWFSQWHTILLTHGRTEGTLWRKGRRPAGGAHTIIQRTIQL